MLGGMGYGLLALALVWLALLSRRLGRVTHAPPYYRGLLAAALLIAISAAFRIIHGITETSIPSNAGWVLVYHGLPAIGLTIGVGFAWRYWSWLLAERD